MSTLQRLARAAARAAGRPSAGPRRPPGSAGDPHAAYRDPAGPELVAMPAVRHTPHLDDDPRLVILLPHLSVEKMSGGPNTALQIAARVAERSTRVRFVATSGPLDADHAGLRAHIRRISGVDLHPDIADFVAASGRRATLDLGRDDVLLATWWPTAHLADAALAQVRAREFLYLVQDYEPGFYPWSTKAALADATYRMPIRPIINEPFLERYLRDGGIGRFTDPAAPSVTFMPAVDRSLFARSAPAAGGPRRLVFYARPRNPRNLFELGLRALRLAAQRGAFDGASWEFMSIGQDVPDLQLSERHTLRAQPWLSYEAYAALLGSSDVMLSLMLSPHTSYPPLEMASAGGRVVTNTYGPKTAAALAAISPTIHGVVPEVEPLVEALRAAAAPVAGAPAPQPVDLPDSWDAALVDVIPWLRRQLAELRAG